MGGKCVRALPGSSILALEDYKAEVTHASIEPFTATLIDDLRVVVREVGPADSDLIELGFGQLSDHSRFLRFMAPKNELTAKEIHRFSAPNDQDHVAIGAIKRSGDGSEPVGIARYIRSEKDRKIADVAVTVVDRFHRMGVGTLLLSVLAKSASANGIGSFSALILDENQAMLTLLSRMGAQKTAGTGPEISLLMPVFLDPSHYPENVVGDRMRQAYEIARVTS